uniref:Metalloendopeptidase n=1 Tax=Schistosoma mansoni TaxID=6183 RepID=A0A3Q0KFI6_SCHMA
MFYKNIITSIIIIIIDYIHLYNQKLLIINATQLTRYQRSLSMKNIILWPNGIVPYIIDDIDKTKSNEFTEYFNKLDVLLIKKAMSIIEEETCIQFYDLTSRTNTRRFYDRHLIRIKGRGQRGCYSSLGMMRNKNQVLRLGPTCRTVGQILHELLHALGVMHEIMRPDRDQYVILHEENIDKSYLEEFKKIKEHQSILTNRKFDFQSISLYDPFTFTSNGNPVWEPIINLDDVPLFSISEKYLSFEDTVGLNRLYKCDRSCSNQSTLCEPGEFRNKHCVCINASKYAFDRCKDDVNETKYCSDAVSKNKCYDEAKYAIPFCRRTCGRCFRAGSIGISTPPKKLCQDVEINMCETYVKEGYCHFDGWTKLNCQYSCNLCPSPDVVKRQVETSDVRAYLEAYRKGDCFNRYDDLRCEVFAERGDCRTNPGFMSSQCTQSCGLCPDVENQRPNGSYTQSSNTIRLPAPCRNYIDDQRCDALAKEGKCFGTTLKQCLGSCNKCGDNYQRQTTEIPHTTTTNIINNNKSLLSLECEDQSLLCSYYKNTSECKTNKIIMLEMCPKTCESCETNCEDIDSLSVCNDLVQRGYCNLSKPHTQRCKKSCGICKDTKVLKTNSSMSNNRTSVIVSNRTTEIGKIISTTTVAPTNSVTFSTTKDSLNGIEMTSTISRTAEISSRKPSSKHKFVTKRTYLPSEYSEDKQECIDRYPKTSCVAWKNTGYCNFPHVSKLCLKTCHLCKTIELLSKYRPLII